MVHLELLNSLAYITIEWVKKIQSCTSFEVRWHGKVYSMPDLASGIFKEKTENTGMVQLQTFIEIKLFSSRGNNNARHNAIYTWWGWTLACCTPVWCQGTLRTIIKWNWKKHMNCKIYCIFKKATNSTCMIEKRKDDSVYKSKMNRRNPIWRNMSITHKNGAYQLKMISQQL